MREAFTGSVLFAIVSLVLAGVLGFVETGLVDEALRMMFLAGVLGAMETSLSLDNAVVNAAILKDMSPRWQHRFMTWGIVVAVFGMRIVFPVLILSFSAMLWPWEAAWIAVTDHARYEAVVTQAHTGIVGFGGAFLMLVGLTFFADAGQEHRWVFRIVEKPLAVFTAIPFAPYFVTVGMVILLSLLAGGGEQWTFLFAGLIGTLVYGLVQKFGDWVGGSAEVGGRMVRSGIGAFFYLEFLDASFSFDGVIGAFAITNDIVLIALGLGIGAMFVRSMTLVLVHGGHLADFRFLESGAFYAILALATLMLLSIWVTTPEFVTGLIGAGMIGASIYASVRHRRRFPQQYAEGVLPGGQFLSGGYGQ